MESAAYGSSHLPSPALVVFSQAAGGLGEALRIQRPFHSQLQDAKDLHHLSLVGSYGAHLLHGFPPHFLHPSVSSANTGSSPFSGGGGAFVKPFPSPQHQHQSAQQHQSHQSPHHQQPPISHHQQQQQSAFAPPKCSGGGIAALEQNMLFSGSESFRTDSSSPACASLSPPVKEESLEGHNTSEEGDRDRICSPERSPEAPGFRPPKSTNGAEPLNLRMDTAHSLYRFPFYNSFKNFHPHQAGIPLKKPLNLGTPPPNSCPVCGIQLSPSELESHFHTELDRLYKLSCGADRHRMRTSFNINSLMHSHSGGGGGILNTPPGPDSRWETFQRIRNNRQNRLRAKTRKRKSDSESEFTEQQQQQLRNAQCQSCPVCHGRLQRTPEEIAQHVEECLRKNGPSRDATEEEDETVDVESYGDETSNTAVNLAPSGTPPINHHNLNHNNNNHIVKIGSAHSSPQDHRPDEHIITSMTNPWDRKHRFSIASMASAAPPPPPPQTHHTAASIMMTNVARATPTSSDQVSDYDDHHHASAKERLTAVGHTSINNNDEEDVIVDNTDEDEVPAKKQRICDKASDNNCPEEATSSMEIDSATETSAGPKPGMPTPDSYVSTSEPAEPTSRAQVLEELRARIRELEGSPFKVRSSQDEDHYKCYICKESYISPVISTRCWHVQCADCWISITPTEKSCPRCKVCTPTSELRKIYV